MKIAIVGSGNIATFYAKKFHAAGHEIAQVISAHLTHAKELADNFQCDFSDDIHTLNSDADIFLFAVKDDVLLSFAKNISLKDKLVIHTAGSVHLDELKDLSDHLACIWCVYSINKNNLPENNSIPLVVDTNNNEVLDKVNMLAKAISDNIFYLNDEQKSALHLAAVFANNFTNHLYTISKKIIEQKNIPFETLLPLIMDTATKLQHSAPEQNQTGPAIRHDEKTMEKHLALLQDEEWKKIYAQISDSIRHTP